LSAHKLQTLGADEFGFDVSQHPPKRAHFFADPVILSKKFMKVDDPGQGAIEKWQVVFCLLALKERA